jgi:hypothetical protein
MTVQTFTARIDDATKGISQASSVRADTRTALVTCQASLATVFTTRGLNAKDKQAVDDKLIDIARYLESAMR